MPTPADTIDLTKQLITHLAPEYDTKGNGTRYSDEIKALALTLRTQGLSYNKIAQKLGCNHDSVYQWCKDTNLLERFGITELSARIKRTLSSKLYHEASHAINRITDKDLDKASFKDKVIGASIMIEKARLMEDRSTANVSISARYQEDLESGIDEISTQIDELQKQIE